MASLNPTQSNSKGKKKLEPSQPKIKNRRENDSESDLHKSRKDQESIPVVVTPQLIDSITESVAHTEPAKQPIVRVSAIVVQRTTIPLVVVAPAPCRRDANGPIGGRATVTEARTRRDD